MAAFRGDSGRRICCRHVACIHTCAEARPKGGGPMSAIPASTAPDGSTAPPDGSSATVVTGTVSFEELLKLTTYHREATEKRRALAMQAFIGLIFVDLLLAR